MATEDDIHRILGKLAISFSALEYNVDLMLEYLVQGNPWIRPLFIDDLSYFQVIQRCRRAALIRFVDDAAKLEEVKQLLNKVDKLRQTRNLFVHGQWLIFPGGSQSISILTFKLRRNEQADIWEYLQDERVSVAGLKKRQQEVDALLQDVQKFNETNKPMQ